MLDFRFSQNIYAVTIIRTLNIHFSFYFKYFISFQLEFQCIMLLVHNMKFNLPLGITIFSLYFLLSLASAVFVRASLSPRRCLCCRSPGLCGLLPAFLPLSVAALPLRYCGSVDCFKLTNRT